MKSIFKKLNIEILKKIMFIFSAILFALYVFFVPSFGESKNILLRYSIYGILVLLFIISVLYCYFFVNLKLNKVCAFVAFFVIYALIGTCLYSHEFRSWLSLLLLFISFITFIYTFKILKNKYLIISLLTVGLFIFSLYFIYHYRNDIINFKNFDSFRLGDYFDNQNGVAAYAIIGVGASFYMIFFWKNKFRYLFILPLLTITLMGLTTGSKTFILLFGVFLLIYLFFVFKKHKFIYFIVVLGLLVLSIVLLNLPFLSTIKDRLLLSLGTIFGFGPKTDTSTLERAIWFDYGFYLGFKRLIFGYGTMGFAVASGVGTYSHSNFAEVFCDFGIIGFILFYTPLIIILFKSFKEKRISKEFTITFVFYYIFASISNVIYYKKFYYIILALLVYLTYFEYLQAKEKNVVKDLKNVVFTCDSMKSGGAERVISLLSNYFDDSGINVTIIGVADRENPSSFYKLNENVKYINLSNNTGKRINSFKRVHLLRKLIISLNPDIIISFLPNANIYTWLSLCTTNIPYIVSERNNPYVDPKEKLMRALKKCSFKYAKGAVFQTKDAMNYFSKDIVTKSVVIKNPVTMNYTPSMCCENKEKVVLAVGRLTEQKNYYCLLDAFKKFNAVNNNEYKLKIYGDGKLKNDLINYCNELSIASNTLFMGLDNEWQKKEYNDAVYVLSSNYEGMPNTLLEAMILGIPCVSTDCPIGASREIIVDGENGGIVPINDSDALVDKMIEIVNDDSKKYFNNTRKMINEYSIENIGKCWLKYILCLKEVVYE